MLFSQLGLFNDSLQENSTDRWSPSGQKVPDKQKADMSHLLPFSDGPHSRNSAPRPRTRTTAWPGSHPSTTHAQGFTETHVYRSLRDFSSLDQNFHFYVKPPPNVVSLLSSSCFLTCSFISWHQPSYVAHVVFLQCLAAFRNYTFVWRCGCHSTHQAPLREFLQPTIHQQTSSKPRPRLRPSSSSHTSLWCLGMAARVGSVIGP